MFNHFLDDFGHFLGNVGGDFGNFRYDFYKPFWAFDLRFRRLPKFIKVSSPAYAPRDFTQNGVILVDFG